MGWRPIETVPKDGAEVLLTDGWNLAVARWDPDSWPDADQSNSCWSISDWHNDPIHLRGGYSATHWMPLSTPPEVTRRAIRDAEKE